MKSGPILQILFFLAPIWSIWSPTRSRRNQSGGAVVLVSAFHTSVLSNHRQDTFLSAARVAITTNSRVKRVTALKDWSERNGIKTGGVKIESIGEASGLGLVASQTIPSGSVVTTVPSNIALTVEVPGGPDDPAVFDLCSDRKAFRKLPWFVQFSLYLYKLDTIRKTKSSGPKEISMEPWLDTLPRSFDTPIHWSKSSMADLQYEHMVTSVDRQTQAWKGFYLQLQSCSNVSSMKWEDFLWGCECARSRAFSGAYTGSAFNPAIYAFTLALVTIYVGLNLGTLEQAANGAGLVLCASILRDFVLPKLFKTKKYVICPVIDMCNHRSVGASAQVAFEFFSDAYSLAADVQVNSGNEVFISYGSRSNDQLLQYYGFVEQDNPHDVYVMPPLRNWDIAGLEEAIGRPFAPGRLEKLDRAGLLGRDTPEPISDDGEGSGNPYGGVVLTKSVGLDPAVLQALRALVSTEDEWQNAGEAVGNFAAEVTPENERRAKLAARTAIEAELDNKLTTLEEDLELMKRLLSSSKSNPGAEERLALQFRIEKKKLLRETMDRLR
jgi:hypothetical protein